MLQYKKKFRWRFLMNLPKVELLRNVLVEKQTTFLFGAGASAPFFSSLGNIENVLSDLYLNDNGKKLIKVLFYIKSIKDNYYLIRYMKGIEKNDDKTTLMIDILDKYTCFIHNVVEFMKLRNSRISPRRTNIVTTNYDLFFEASIENILQQNSRIFFNDGSNGYIKRVLNTENFNKTLLHSGVFDNYYDEMPSINLIKCHGSINWSKSVKKNQRDRIQVNSNFNDINIMNTLLENKLEVINHIIAEESKVLINDINNLDDLFGLLNVQYTNELRTDINLLGDKVSSVLEKVFTFVNELQIVLPTKRKFQTTLIEEQYFNMLRFLSYELEKEQVVLIVFGFSFYDEHIVDVVERSLNNPSLLIFIFCYEDSTQTDIISRFSFSEGSIPGNIIFIKPSDFLEKKIEISQYNVNDYPLNKKLKDDNFCYIYDPIIELRDIGHNEGYRPIIDFKVFNKIIEGSLTNKYINKFYFGENENE